MAKRPSGLGRGLEAIFIENDTENKSTTYLQISEIEPNRKFGLNSKKIILENYQKIKV